MPDQKPGAKGTTKVTFTLPREVEADSVALCGDFNDWSPTAHPLKKYKDGHFGVSVSLASGVYRYRFLIDGARWENDWQADEYAPNEYGSDDSIVRV
jgi:1,4-alpha-glucan branching enzyme